MKKQKILIVKLSAIGDVVMALPMVEAAKKKYGKDVEITWVCGKTASPIIKTFFKNVKLVEVDEKKLLKGSFLEKVIEGIKLWLKIAIRKFDLVATAHSDIRYRLLTLPVIAKVKRHWGMTDGRKHPVPGRYHGIEAVWLITGDDDYKLEEFPKPLDNRMCQYLKASTGGEVARSAGGVNEFVVNPNYVQHTSSKAKIIENTLSLNKIYTNSVTTPSVFQTATSPQGEALEMDCHALTSFASNDDSRKKVVLVPGGAKNILSDNPCRRWSLNNYVELTKELLKKDYEVILVGSDSDKWVNDAFDRLNVNNLIGKTNLIELLSLLRQADFVITHDTGTLHLAQLVAKKVIALFGPTNPYEKVQKSDSNIIVWKPENLPCCPCYDGKTYADCIYNQCMDKITVKEVLESIQSCRIS